MTLPCGKQTCMCLSKGTTWLQAYMFRLQLELMLKAVTALIQKSRCAVTCSFAAVLVLSKINAGCWLRKPKKLILRVLPLLLAAGHNGCLHCFATVQSRKPECPLCRAPFDPRQQLVCNHELRDLVTLATSMYMDDTTKQEGWEAFPDAKLMTEHYASEVKQERMVTEHTFNALIHNINSMPSAPALPSELGLPGNSDKDLLLLDPPQWLPDSYASNCAACQLPFKAVLRLRHHCRLCGKIFCHSCSSKKLLLPPKFHER